ncbi:hypothetical protein BDV95DRAFT_81231 [Massariosphaeria phaeospora]|uniref:Uncharacterized protein n=1 Tax=Massariosphaeria phaeospora TaxID=100035 RepID=A0A7C8MIX6_9PLEO|nr:hypothetical protein BDV95DRAFT_81231 [Massariosphaeria phaeospora]
MASIRTSVPFPTEPWEAAKQKFLEALSEEDIKRFKDATLENVFYGASSTQKKHAHGSRSWAIQERLSSLVDGIDDYGKALDVYANTYGLILSPIWGSIRVVLHIAREAGKFQDKLVDMFVRIGDALPRFRIYQTLYRKHERLLAALSAAYLDILRFCTHTKDFFVRARRTPIPLSIICMSVWKPFRQEFEEFIAGFRKHQKRVEKEAGLAHMIETARVRDIELANQVAKKRDAQIQRRHRILSCLPTVDFQAKHNRNSGLRYPGTNTWIQTHPAFKAWRDTQISDCLCCYGIPGSGKSVLAASVVEDLQPLVTGEASFLCCYYFDYADTLSLDPRYLIATLVLQVMIRLPSERFDEHFSCPFEPGQPTPSYTKIIEFLAQTLQDYKRLFVVLDGIDELAPESRASALKLIKDFVEHFSIPVKLFATSRNKDCLGESYLKHGTIDISTEQMHQDVSLFVEQTIETSAQKQNPLFRNPKLKAEVVSAVVMGANGMFLWAKFQLYDIMGAPTEASIHHILRHLPRDLSETYARILQKIYSSPGGRQKIEITRKVFRWVACARRPLRMVELEEAVFLEKSDTYFHTERTAPNPHWKIADLCGNLVVLDAHDKTVRFAHYTVQQYLISDTADRDQSASMHFDIGTADVEIGQICVAYLCFSDFETQLTRQPTFPMDQDHAEAIIWNRVPMRTLVQSVISWVKPRSVANSNPVQFASPVQMDLSSVLKDKYVLLEYIVDFWAFHTSRFSDSATSCWADFKHVALYRQLIFEFRPWNTKAHLAQVPQGHIELTWMPIYSWALQHGNRPLLRLLASDSFIKGQMEVYLKGRELSFYRFLFQEGRGSNSFMRVTYFDLLTSLTLSSTLEQNFWDANMVYHAYRRTWSSNHAEEFLQFLQEELEYHSAGVVVDLDEIAYDAAMLALQLDDIGNFETLVASCQAGSTRSSRLLTTMVRQGHTRIKPVMILLSTPSRTSDLETLFALDRCLPPIDTAIRAEPNLVSQISEISIWQLLILCLLNLKEYSDLASILAGTSVDISRTLQLPSVDWTQFILGTEDLFNKLCAFRDEQVLCIAFDAVRSYTETRAYKVDIKAQRSCSSILCTMLQRYSDTGSDVATVLENNRTGTLDWAVNEKLVEVVGTLTANYTKSWHPSSRSDKRIPIVIFSALVTALRSEPCFLAILDNTAQSVFDFREMHVYIEDGLDLYNLSNIARSKFTSMVILSHY